MLSSSLRGAPSASPRVAAVDTSQCSRATAPAHSQVARVIAAPEETEEAHAGEDEEAAAEEEADGDDAEDNKEKRG